MVLLNTEKACSYINNQKKMLKWYTTHTSAESISKLLEDVEVVPAV